MKITAAVGGNAGRGIGKFRGEKQDRVGVS